jgi:hypothetical protein
MWWRQLSAAHSTCVVHSFRPLLDGIGSDSSVVQPSHMPDVMQAQADLDIKIHPDECGAGPRVGRAPPALRPRSE